MSGLPTPLGYVGVEELGSAPHVVVDGAARAGTVCTLSHWPNSPTPRELWRDTSAEIALAYLESPSHWARGADAVTNDHLDEDGLASLYVLAEPEDARRRARLLVALACGGDFGVIDDDAVLKVVLSLQHLFDPERSVLASGARVARGDLSWTSHCYREALRILPELLGAPDAHPCWFGDERAVIEESRRAIASGAVELREDAELGLAVFTSASEPLREPFRTAHGVDLGLHPVAMNSATNCARVLTVLGERVAYYDRYETWVRYVSRRLERRRELAPLAVALGRAEPGGLSWRADSASTLVAYLAPSSGYSELGKGRITAALGAHLRRAPVGWDPFGARPIALSGREAPRGGTTGRAPSRWRGPRRRAR